MRGLTRLVRCIGGGAFALLLTACTTAQEMRTLTIVATVPEGSGTVFLTGNQPELGPWNPALLAMEGMGRERTATLQVEEGTEVRFKFTEGSWAREAVDPNCTVPPDTAVVVTGDMTHQAEIQMFRSPDRECPWQDPLRWENAIKAFEEADRGAMPAPGLILATGSSSIAHWHDTIKSDLAPMEIIPRGFGGSTINDLVHYTPRVVLPYKPAAILVYEGDNDIAGGVFPETVLAKFKEFMDLVRADLPETRLYILAVKPSPSRWDQWPLYAKLNAGLKSLCEADDKCVYIDVASPMLGADGKARPELFGEDMLHMNELGYALWSETVKAAMLPRESGVQ
jgi:lysophospholipase L1-like esterase